MGDLLEKVVVDDIRQFGWGFLQQDTLDKVEVVRGGRVRDVQGDLGPLLRQSGGSGEEARDGVECGGGHV